MTDIVERLRARLLAPDADHILDEAADEIVMLRADLLKAEMKAELDDLEDVGRLVAIGRREGIEAAAARCDTREVGWGGVCGYREQEAADCAAAIRALLEEPRRG